MTDLAILATGALMWAAAGAAGYLWWWTSEYDLTLRNVPTLLIGGCLNGPLAWALGASLHYRRHRRPGNTNPFGERVLIRCRDRRRRG